jgi:hypothetical protein
LGRPFPFSAGPDTASSDFAPRLAARAVNSYALRLRVSASPQPILCDGCGAAATPEHIRERVERLELATRFRPIHISVLFLIPSPEAGLDFYDASPRPPGPREILLDALGIPSSAQSAAVLGAQNEPAASATESRLGDFQRHGFFFASVAECPLPAASAAQALEHLAPTLIKRIQFSYKPKSVVLLSDALSPLVPLLAQAGRGIRIAPDGEPLALPRAGDSASEAAFRAACARIATSART